MTSKPANTRETGPVLAGRQADSARRRQRVITILDRAAASGEEISVSGVARTAGFSELNMIIDIVLIRVVPGRVGGSR